MTTKRTRPVAASYTSGFTLVEMLVVLALIALLSVFLASGMWLGNWHYLSIRHRVDAREPVTVVRGLLRRVIEEAYPAMVRPDGAPPYQSFDGGPDWLILTSRLPVQFDPGGFFRIEMKRTGSGLIIRWEPERNRPGAFQQDVEGHQWMLLDHLSAIRFQYFGDSTDGGARGWFPQWRQRKWLPDLIRIEIDLDDASGGAREILTVGTHVDVDVSCIYDPFTSGCRGR